MSKWLLPVTGRHRELGELGELEGKKKKEQTKRGGGGGGGGMGEEVGVNGN